MDENKDKAAEVEEVNDPVETATEDTQDTAEGADLTAVLALPEVQALIQKGITDGIQAALKGKTPSRNTTSPTATERAEFDKMGYKDRLKLFNADPAKYNKLVGGK